LVIFLNGRKLAYKTDNCLLMLIPALFTIIKARNLPRCPSAVEWVKRKWYINIIGYYSVTRGTKSCHL
jgi:hypothetical protein